MDQITELIRQAAEKLGMGVSYIWPTLVGYTWAHALGTLITFILLLVGLLLLDRWTFGKASAEHKSDLNVDYVPFARIAFGISCCFTLIVVVAFITNLADIVAILMYPEARTIINLIPKKT